MGVDYRNHPFAPGLPPGRGCFIKIPLAAAGGMGRAEDEWALHKLKMAGMATPNKKWESSKSVLVHPPPPSSSSLLLSSLELSNTQSLCALNTSPPRNRCTISVKQLFVNSSLHKLKMAGMATPNKKWESSQSVLVPPPLNLRTTTSQKCGSIPRRARIQDA